MALLGLTIDAHSQEKAGNVPKIVVNIQIDQLRTDYLDAFAPLYSSTGLKRLLNEGVVYVNAYYPFAPIDRASAISSIQTGAVPYYHSITGQRWLDKETLQTAYCVDNQRKPGTSTAANMLTSTMGDELKVATAGQAKVAAVAPYRDAAILSAGHAADLALWIDDQTGQWTTCDYYQQTLPQWVKAYNEKADIDKQVRTTTWKPVSDVVGSFSFFLNTGNQKPFAHAFKGDRRFRQYKASALVNSHVTDMAEQCFINMALANDRITDMLTLTYYAGNYDHNTLTECQTELQDTYVRLDQEISRLTKYIESRVGKDNVLFILTSTGYSDEESAEYDKYRIPTGTFYINRSANLLNLYFGAIWGQGRYVEKCFGNQIYLNHKLFEQKRISFPDAILRAQDFLSQMSGVRSIFTGQQLIANSNPEIQKVRNGFSAERSGDIVIEVAPGWRLQNEETQETQLSRASYTQFPIVFFGAGLKPVSIQEPVSIERIAPSVAKAIRIRAPNACSAEPLF